MRKRKNMYQTIIEEAMSLPKRERRVIPSQPKPSVLNRLLARRSLKADTKTVAENVYNVIATAAFGTTTIEDKVPVSKLHRHMCLHLNRFVAIAMIREGQLPLNIYIVNRFLAHLDFGHGRVIALRVQLHHTPHKETLASFIVEESETIEQPWLDFFEPVTPFKTDAIPATDQPRGRK